MSGETVITVIGNITADPELRFTQNGLAVVNFTLASTPRRLNRVTNVWEDQETLWVRCSIWRDYAEHVAASIRKGLAVIVIGTLRQRAWETPEGEKRTSWELDADEVAPSLRYATAQVVRTPRTGTSAPDAWAQPDAPADHVAA